MGNLMKCFLYRSVQELFSWLFEVDEDVEGEDRGRLIFSLEYEMTSSRKETFAPVRNKATAFIRYQTENLFTIVPVIKVRSNKLNRLEFL